MAAEEVSMMAKQRSYRVAEAIKEEISALLQKGIKDPRIGFVTVVDVEVSGDSRHARVFVSVMGMKTKRRILCGACRVPPGLCAVRLDAG